MALDMLRLELLRYLKERGAVQEMIDAWALCWHNATAFPEEPFPCPQCFLEDRVERLRPLPNLTHIGAVRCDHCRQVFEFLDE